MKITNKYGLSQAWVDAVLFDSYDKVGWRSVTSLIAPVQQQLLIARHDDKISEDVSDRVWMLLGNGVHNILEGAARKAGNPSVLTEERFTIEVLGKEISMKPDRIELIAGTTPAEFHLKDFKTCTLYAVKAEVKFEWIAQTNLYAFGSRKIDINVTKISMEPLLKNWSKTELARKIEAATKGNYTLDYPECAIKPIEVEVWNDKKCEEYLSSRINAYTEAEVLCDEDLPPCSKEERWLRDEVFQVMKKGGKRSTRNLPTRAEAEEFMKQKELTTKTHSILYKEGVNTRCEFYCPVKHVCKQYNTQINPPF